MNQENTLTQLKNIRDRLFDMHAQGLHFALFLAVGLHISRNKWVFLIQRGGFIQIFLFQGIALYKTSQKVSLNNLS